MKPKPKTTNSAPALIRFDWAMKRLLRQKANYSVLEGFLSVLLNEKIKIINIKDGESNQAHEKDKFNRVDIFVENEHGELYIIELQNSDQADYFLRMLYGVSKATVEHIVIGDKYWKIRKVFHINIVYFKLGQGQDYVYYGSTEFRGIHRHDVLQLTEEQKEFFVKKKRHRANEVKDLFPEYYILCIDDFDNKAKSSLDEWIYFFKNTSVPDEFTAPGLSEVKKKLQFEKLSEQEKIDYEHYLKQGLYEQGAIETALFKGDFRGEIRGIAKGRAEGEAERAQLQAEKDAVQAQLDAAQAEKLATQAQLDAAQKLAEDQAARIAQLEKFVNQKQ